MPTNLATAHWEGSVTKGQGHIDGRTKAFDVPYSLKSRRENTNNTNPEELIGAAHAGCYSMMLSALLTKAGTPPTSIKSSAKVTQELVNEAPTITKIELETEATVPGIDQAQFDEFARNAKENCPVSRALKAVDVQLLSAKLLA